MPTHNFLNHHHHADPSLSSPPPPKPNQKILSLLLKSIIMGLIFSIFLLFISVAAIAFLHILLLGSFLHRRHRTSTPSAAYSLDQLQKHLPPFVYTTDSVTPSNDCSICLEYFKEGELCRTLPSCGHVFHATCVNQWLIRVPNCPVCRAPVQLHPCASDLIVSDDDFKVLLSIGRPI